jgi:hypothetical protein
MQTTGREIRHSRHHHSLWRIILAGAMLATGVCRAEAALTTPACLAKKLSAWGTLRKCQATEGAKTLQERPAHLASCQTSFDAKLAALSARAKAAATPCRYAPNGDGTVIDYDTGLQWEQKTTDATVHDEQNEFDWSSTLGRPDGTVFTDFLGALNAATSSDGTTSGGCFADHCDWRLPSIIELQAIVDAGAQGCGQRSACIDQTFFGPTVAFFYWSETRNTDFPVFTWGVAFGADGSVTDAIQDTPLFARAVRSAL